jgi:hypothetical protein
MPRVVKHAWTHRPQYLGGSDPTRGAVYAIKLFGDEEELATGDGRFGFEIPFDVGGLTLRSVLLYVTTSGSSLTRVQVRNSTAAVDMLSTRVQIDSGELSSRTAATAYVISSTNGKVATGDHVWLDIDDAGTGAMGLGTELQFYP